MEEKKLSTAIRQAREEKGFSQERLAELLEVSRQAVSKWETGLASPTEDNLKRLEGALGLAEGTLSELTQTDEAPQSAAKAMSRKHLAAAALIALAMGGAGFFLGRATSPAPASGEPETKTIWRMTASHRENPHPHDSETRSTYDELGRLLRREDLGSQADPTVRVNEFIYDEAGNHVTQLTYLDGELFQKQEFEYDDMGRQTLSRSILGDGTVEQWFETAYDERGNQISYQLFDGDGRLLNSCRYTYTYYEDGSYEQDYFAPISAGENNPPWHALEYYDAHGNLLSQTEYDMNGNVTRVWTFEYESFEVPADFNPPN